MIDIIITSYKEPKATLRAVQLFLAQDIRQDFRIIVSDPFPEVKEFLKQHLKDKRVGFFLDPGEGKSYALNLLLDKLYSNNNDDIVILTDGDVYVSNNAVKEILKAFEDKEIGCVTGKPVSIDSRNNKYGYWSHFLFAGIDKVRKKLSKEKKFFECSGYLFAVRNGVIKEFPPDACEDSIIPYLFWKQGYKIAYAEKAEVYVKNPGNWKDWVNQKIRNIKGHENLSRIAPDMPRTKSFWNEIKHGWYFLFAYPKNIKEFFWAIQLFFARLYIYLKAFKDLRKKQAYSDGWRENEIESTKMMD
ncbi:glycosyltransferase [Candidatus Pacearchaeota archaeon]|nr:glycosyltransferase [Candidatus Pacearchaeota archaeon]